MKSLKLNFITASILTIILGMGSTQAASLNDYLERMDLPGKVREEIASLDISFSGNLGDIDLIEGVNLAGKYRYEVEASYQDQYYTRIDKWDLKSKINVGDIVDNFVDMPLSFSMNRNNSIFFARQFKEKKSALKALPYSPKRLPLTAELALKNLATGDFVSMPANLNIAFEARASTATVTPIVVSANAGVYWVLSGEFIVQVFKLDESHVRLKIISRRGYDRGATAGAGLSFEIFGIRVLDKQIDRLFDRDLVQTGYVINPGAQFIVDYIFDLKDTESKAAYNQILKTTLKFKDVMILNKLDTASELKDKLISSFEKAEKIFETDKNKEPKDRRVTRLFKGFSDYKGHTKKLKLALLFASYNHDNAYTENKVTYYDKNENNIQFFYPTFSKYTETKFGKWIFDLKDQNFQNNFGLIPRRNAEETKLKNPDFGLSFERKDKFFSKAEQRVIQKFMAVQIPDGIELDLGAWNNGKSKTDARIFFQLILKAQGFNYLKDYTFEELHRRLLAYVAYKQKPSLEEHSTTPLDKLKDFLFINRFTNHEQLFILASSIHTILQNKENNSEIMLKKLVQLNEYGIFDKIGVGFLISLLPEERLEDLVYFNIEMTAQDEKPVKLEYGKLNYRALYNELTKVQSRISSRSYDLRVTQSDHEMENSTTDGLEYEESYTAQDFLGLN